MAKHPVASPLLEPTDATLKAVQRAWLVLQEQRRLFDQFRNYVRDEKLRYDAKSTAAAVNVVKWQIEDFCEQLHHLEVALLTSEQDRRLRWMYDPHCVSCKGNVPEPLSRHDSYSQAVYKFAWQTFLSLPFIESPEMRELQRRSRKPGSPLPKVASSCEIYAEVGERVLATYFDTAELELLVRREYAAVADRLGAVQDTPIDPTKTRYSTWINSRELKTVMKTNGLCEGKVSPAGQEKRVTNTKKLWGAEHQTPTNPRVFRFRLDQLDKLVINYPLTWVPPPPVETD